MGNKVGWALAAAIALTATPRAADACGGCFTQTAGGGTDGTVVTGHRMVMSISQTQSVLWDQFEYSGDPEEFSWVLPVKPGTVIELASDDWLDVLDGATQPTVGSKTVQCTVGNGGNFGGGDSGSGFGCGASDDAGYGGVGGVEEGEDGQADPVTIVSQETVGPYETVTLSTEQPGVLQDWLESHGYAIPEEVAPIIDDYVAEGFDFVALRLIPGVGVSQMSPVRVVMPGAVLTLPLRLVAAGTGAKTALSLFVIAEGIYEAQNFANAVVEPEDIIWDYATESSNYSLLRQQALDGDGGETWLRTYSLPDSLFAPVPDGATERLTDDVDYGGGRSTIADAFLNRALSGQPSATNAACRDALFTAAQEGLTVVEPCDDEGNCRALEPHEIAVEDLSCDVAADDLVTALTGMNLGEVWITRLDAELPRSGLTRDLLLQARSADEVPSRMLATQSINSPCGDQTAGPTPAVLGGPLSRVPGGLPTLGVAMLGLLYALRRRRSDDVPVD